MFGCNHQIIFSLFYSTAGSSHQEELLVSSATRVVEAGDGGWRLSSTTHVVEAADARLWLARLVIAIHGEEGVGGLDDDSVGVDGPVEVVEDGGEGIGDGDVVMDEEAVLVSATFRHTPAHDLGWAS